MSMSQIANALGLRSGGGRLHQWLRGVPPPEWTARPNAKDEMRQEAIALRRGGLSYREIRDQLPVSKSTLSLWLRDVPLTEEQRHARGKRAVGASASRAEANRAVRARRRANTEAEARAQVSELAESELFVAGVVAYWAEGAKNKPWRTGTGVKFMNSDPALIRVFLAWLRLMEVTDDRLVFRLQIHESGDAAGAVRFWADVVGVSSADVSTTLKRHNPRTVRKNTGEDYHGCLAVYIRRSAELNLRIAGWFAGLAEAAASTAGGDTVMVSSRGSSKGKTAGFGPENGGSIPPPRADQVPPSGFHSG
jgi:transposase